MRATVPKDKLLPVRGLTVAANSEGNLVLTAPPGGKSAERNLVAF